jgi:REP element-mobilizing transposase RayT
MSVKYTHSDVYNMYHCTFTCYNWLPLIAITKSYDTVYNWFNILAKENIPVVAYVIMPNHIHCILYFPDAGFSLSSQRGFHTTPFILLKK